MTTAALLYDAPASSLARNDCEVSDAIGRLSIALSHADDVDALLDDPNVLASIEVLAHASARRAKRRGALMLSRDASRVVLPNGLAVDFSQRDAPRRILLALAEASALEPGTGVHWTDLLALGWPDEKVALDAGFRRVRTAIWTLRRLGVRQIARTRAGYAIDPSTSIAWDVSNDVAPVRSA